MKKSVTVLLGLFLVFACEGKLNNVKKTTDAGGDKGKKKLQVTYTADGTQQTKEIESTIIGSDFLKDSKLTKLTIPDGVTTIGDSAFTKNQLAQVTISKDLYTKLEKAKRLVQVFGNVARYQSHDGIALKLQVTYTADGRELTKEFEDTTIVQNFLKDSKLTKLTIPEGVTTIGGSAFMDNQLTKLTIPEGVTTIGDSAFYGNQLIKLTIPSSVRIIDLVAFQKNQLTELTILTGVTEIRHSAFFNNQLTEIIIPDSVTTMGNMAFAQNPLTKVTISSSLYENLKRAKKLTNIFGTSVTKYQDHNGNTLN